MEAKQRERRRFVKTCVSTAAISAIPGSFALAQTAVRHRLEWQAFKTTPQYSSLLIPWPCRRIIVPTPTSNAFRLSLTRTSGKYFRGKNNPLDVVEIHGMKLGFVTQAVCRPLGMPAWKEGYGAHAVNKAGDTSCDETRWKASLCNVDLRGGYPGYRSDVFISQTIMQSIFFPTDTYQISLRRWFAYFAYALIIILGTLPGARAEVGEVASGFFLHFTAYAFLAALLFTGYYGSPGGRAVRTVLIVATMGAFDEFVQSFLPYRNGSINDWYVDVTAAITAVGVLAQLLLKAQRKILAGTNAAGPNHN